MPSMDSYPKAAMERAMKVQDVNLQAMAKKITWSQAAEILGISDRHMRRWRERYVEEGYNGLFNRRRGMPSRRRVPVATVEKVFALYRGEVFRSERAALSREVAGQARDGAELHLAKTGAAGSGHGGARAQARSASPTAPASPPAGDAAAHRRDPAPVVPGRALVRSIVILDDATSEIYYAQLVEETATVMAGLKEVIGRKGVFCALYSDRGSHSG
jgi:winged helix-turn helix protein